MEILGWQRSIEGDHSGVETQYFASLIDAKSTNPKFELQFANNIVYNQKFIGENTALIRQSWGGSMTITDNVFFDIGYLNIRTSSQQMLLPYNASSTARRMPFATGPVSRYQRVGIFLLQNELSMPGMVNTFRGNRFRKIYGHHAGIYFVQTSGFRSIRMHLEGNYYHEVFGDTAGIMGIEHGQAVAPADGAASSEFKAAVFDLLEAQVQDIGIVMLKDEVVSQCQATHAAAGLYTATARAQLLSFIVRDSIFTGNFLSIVHFDKVGLYCNNCTFSGDALEDTLSQEKVKSFEAGLADEIKSKMFQDYKLTLQEHFSEESGLLLKPTGMEILFEVADHEDKLHRYTIHDIVGPNAGGEYRLITLTDVTNAWGLFSSTKGTNSSEGRDPKR